MANGTVVGQPWIANARIYLSVAVAEGDKDLNGNPINTEYTGSLPYDAAFQALTVAQKKAALVAAVKAARDAQQAASAVALAGITGTVTL